MSSKRTISTDEMRKTAEQLRVTTREYDGQIKNMTDQMDILKRASSGPALDAFYNTYLKEKIKFDNLKETINIYCMCLEEMAALEDQKEMEKVGIAQNM